MQRIVFRDDDERTEPGGGNDPGAAVTATRHVTLVFPATRTEYEQARAGVEGIVRRSDETLPDRVPAAATEGATSRVEPAGPHVEAGVGAVKRGSRYARDDQDAGQPPGTGRHMAQLGRYGAKTVGGNELNTLTDGAASSPNSSSHSGWAGTTDDVSRGRLHLHDLAGTTTARKYGKPRAFPVASAPPRRGYEQRGGHDVGQLELQQRLHIERLSPRCRREHPDAPLPAPVQPLLRGAARAVRVVLTDAMVRRFRFERAGTARSGAGKRGCDEDRASRSSSP